MRLLKTLLAATALTGFTWSAAVASDSSVNLTNANSASISVKQVGSRLQAKSAISITDLTTIPPVKAKIKVDQNVSGSTTTATSNIETRNTGDFEISVSQKNPVSADGSVDTGTLTAKTKISNSGGGDDVVIQQLNVKGRAAANAEIIGSTSEESEPSGGNNYIQINQVRLAGGATGSAVDARIEGASFSRIVAKQTYAGDANDIDAEIVEGFNIRADLSQTTGSNNQIFMLAMGQSNSSTVKATQDGSWNTAQINLNNSTNGTHTLAQTGLRNSASIKDTDGDSNTFSIKQTGENGSALIDADNSVQNTFSLAQNGAAFASVLATGSGMNTLSLTQTGAVTQSVNFLNSSGNTLTLSQSAN